MTTNSNGTSDFITLGPYLGNNNPVSYFVGFFVGKSSGTPFASVDLTIPGGFKALYNGNVVHSFSTPFVAGHRYKRQVMAMGAKLVYSVDSESFSYPITSVAGKLTTAIDGIQWPGQATPLPYAAVTSTFCHTRNYFQTCHIYNSTPDSTKRISDTMTPVTMVTTEKGAGYTATSSKGSATSPMIPPSAMPPISKIPPTMSKQMQPAPPSSYVSPSIDTGLLILGGFILVAVVGSMVFR